MRVLIAGAGPAGLALAKALTKKGARCTVFERSPHVIPSACFMLGVNGALACRAVGLYEHISPLLRPTRYSTILNHSGKVLAKTGDLNEELRDKYGITYGILKRQEFCEAAIDALPEGTVRFNSEVVASKDLGDAGVRVTLANGRVEVGDVFVGADGVGSRTRDSMFPPAELKWSGFLLYYGLTDTARLPPEVVPPPHTVVLGYGRSGQHYAVRFNLGEEVYWAVYQRSAAPVAMGASAYQEEDKGRLLGKLEHWKDEQLKAAIYHTKTLVRTEHYVPPSDYLGEAWHSGKIGVMGDAAHKVMPFTGQGLNMALDDALCLARCLVTLPTEEAFKEYHRVRLLRTVDARDKAVRMGELQLPRSAVVRTLRNLVLWTLNATGLYTKLALKGAAQLITQVEATEREVAAFDNAAALSK